jgi:predicted dithiol-disulfide oxidoreductase (DUF899 family)
MTTHFPNESAAYRKARDELTQLEIALRRQMEAVAVARRSLPPGGIVNDDYVFQTQGQDGGPRPVKLSELFQSGTGSLAIYNYMFPRHKSDQREAATSGEIAKLPKDQQPCPSCTGLIDQLNAAAPHFEAGGGNFAVAANAPIEHLVAVARDRGWKHVRLLSSVNSPFKRDYNAQDEEGQQIPLMTVFTRDADGTMRMFWASELCFAPSDPGQDHRAAGTIEPFWNLFDLTREGRPDFNEQLQYPCCRGRA